MASPLDTSPRVRRSASQRTSAAGEVRAGPTDHEAAIRLLAAMASIRRVARRTTQRPDELSGLTGNQLELVRFVRRTPGASVADAANELRLAPNTVSTLVRQLGDAGVLLRRTDDGDRRVARLDLSPEVRRRVDAWRDRRALALGAALSRLPEPEHARLAAALPALEALATTLADLAGER